MRSLIGSQTCVRQNSNITNLQERGARLKTAYGVNRP